MTTELKNEREQWSFQTKELIETLPLPWTRGLLYFLILLVSIVLPWAIFSKVEETGVGTGRIEPQGETVKLDALAAGKVERIYVREGQEVKAGQPILQLDSSLIRKDIQQAEEKIAGQKSRLSQQKIIKNQLEISLTTQRQQNRAAEAEKKASIEQARENINALVQKAKISLEEQAARVDQAKTALARSQTDYPILKSRYEIALQEVERYRKAWEDGAISEVQFIEREDNAKERQQLYERGKAEVKENQEKVAELESAYRQIRQQTSADIAQARLQLQERKRGYQSLRHANDLALSRIQEQIKNLDADIASLASEIAQSTSQRQALQIQLGQRVFKANTDGTIFLLPIKRAGAVVQSGTRVAEIAPKGSRFILKAEMPTDQSQFLRAGMPVKVKFDAYPFQDYGIIGGQIIKRSPTAIEKETAKGKINVFELEIQLDRSCIQKGSQCIPFNPGDTATAEAIVRQRRVIDYILDPFKDLQKDGLKL
ncbi:HlyD family efflux transporter periplasmic adaptor subunit [Pannus brasiliensis CCIBt3594]|uniref:HlyD family efflux transporter periplasmic adaptor subunit n=1 Tax=Pannus brasiliensis CCIBt3594 TaxID=1427578 RepID=A0AAW9R113_9CHRO